jgi:large subunit ribosomal protein L29
MKASEAHALNDQQLVEQIRDARQEAFSLRFRHATGELENTSRVAGSRRDVARLLTVARQRGIDVDRELSKFDDEKK